MRSSGDRLLRDLLSEGLKLAHEAAHVPLGNPAREGVAARVGRHGR